MSEPDRLMHVVTTLSRGGAENHVVELVRHQRARGASVSVAFLRGTGTWTKELSAIGADVHNLRLRFYGDITPLLQLRRLIRRYRPALLHAHMPPAELYSRLALGGISRDALPLIITKHNEEPFYRGPFNRPIGRLVGRRAAAVIAISDAVRRYMTGPKLGLPDEQVHTIYYGIDPTPFARVPEQESLALRQEWGVPPTALLIGFVGRLVPQKSLETLLEAFALFKAGGSADARLALVGTGALEGALRRRAEVLQIDNEVVWPGFRSDVPVVMRAFDVFALSSTYEGLGLVLLEAMAASRAVVATRAGAIPEVVVDGETGIVVGIGKADEFARAFVSLCDPARRAQLGEAGRRRVSEKFTLEHMHARTEELYRRTCRRTNGTS